MKQPCRECEDRRVGCHGQCARFIAWDIWCSEKKRKADRNKAMQTALSVVELDRSYSKKKKITGRKKPER